MAIWEATPSTNRCSLKNKMMHCTRNTEAIITWVGWRACVLHWIHAPCRSHNQNHVNYCFESSHSEKLFTHNQMKSLSGCHVVKSTIVFKLLLSYPKGIIPICMQQSTTKSKEEESTRKKQIHSSVKPIRMKKNPIVFWSFFQVHTCVLKIKILSRKKSSKHWKKKCLKHWTKNI